MSVFGIATAAFGGAVVYPDFSNPSGLNLGGSAGIVSSSDGTVLRLTPAQTLKAGSAFHTSTVSLTRFTTFFQFRITQTGFLPADGLVFVIQPAAFGVGEVGGQEGYGGLHPSVAVEFDTIQNSWDLNDNHVSILINGDVTRNLGTGPFTPGSRLANGDLWSVWIDYDGSTLEVRLADGSSVRPASAQLAAVVDIPGILGQSAAHLGFTAATGTYSENHDIVTWQFHDLCAVSLGAASASFAATGGSASVAVSAPSGCAWSVLSTAPWIHPSTGVLGAGTSTLAFTVDANTGNARNTFLQIGEQTFTIAQAGAPVTNLPRINAGGVADPWTYTPGLSPGAWVSIFGTNLSNSIQTWSPRPGQPLPTVLGGVAVTIDGLASPLSYVSPGLINALVPASVRQGPVAVVVNNQGLAGSAYTIQSTPILPAIYSNPPPGSTPLRYMVTAVDPVSGQLVGSASADSRVGRTAHPGDTIDLYAVGMGPSTPQFPTDTAAAAAYSIASGFDVLLGNVAIQPDFAAQVAPGLYQVRITIPAATTPGDLPVALDFSVGRSAPNVYLTVQ